MIEDAKTAGRWYFLVLMGRKAGFLALGAAKAAGATVALIPEEFPAGAIRLEDVVRTLEGSIVKRRAEGHGHGVAVLAEGIAERFDPAELDFMKDVERDEHGHVRLAEVPLGKLLRTAVAGSLASRGVKLTIGDKDVGYELRCVPPTAFDRDYTRDLGVGAVRTLLAGRSNALITRQASRIVPIPFAELMDEKTGRTRVREVDVSTDAFASARALQTRVERSGPRRPGTARRDRQGRQAAAGRGTAAVCPDRLAVPPPPRSPQEAAAAAQSPRRPWWIPRFLGPVPPIPDDLLRLLGLVSLALFFESYDLSMLTSALKQIAEGLSIDEREMGGYLGVIRLGALPAFLLIPIADRLGRRRVFLASILGISVFTCLTAFSQTPWQFVALQMVARTFMVTAMACAVVIVTEEFPAEHRGWGVGMMGALAACGVGFGALVFALVDVLPFGWRALYVVGLAPVFLFPLFRRGVRETGRFERSRDRSGPPGSGLRSWLGPIEDMVRRYPGRTLGVGAVSLLAAAGSAPVFQFTGYFVQTVHGWAPWQFSVLVIVGGAIGILGNVLAGRLGDRFGRRKVGFAVMSLFPIFALGFYHGGGWLVPLCWVLFVLCTTAQHTILRSVATELFPTAHRGTASGWNALVETLGAALGLALLALGTRGPGNIAFMTSLLAFAVVGAGLVLLLLPETGRRELESISHEAEA